jgi:NAD(P)H-hydrate epimerase
LDPDTGEYGEDCVLADATVTFHRVKTGLLTAKKIAGIVHLEHIGIPKEAEKGILK